MSRLTKGFIIISLGFMIGCGGLARKKKDLHKAPFSQTEKESGPEVAKESKSDHFELGRSLFHKGDLKGAVKEFEAAVAQSPTSAQMHYNLALAYYELGLYSEAIDEYKKALQLKPDLAEAYFNMGVAYDQAGQVQEAIEAYERAMKYGLEDAAVHFNLGVGFLKLSKFEEAKKEHLKALEMKSDLPQAYNNLGYLSEVAGDINGAIAMYKWALSIKSDYKLAQENLDRLTKGLAVPGRVPKIEKGPMSRLTIEMDGKWGFDKDLEWKFNPGGKVEVGSISKRGLFRIGYDVTNWLDIFVDLGITDLEFEDIPSLKFEKVLGPAGGLGINVEIPQIRRLKLGFDTGLEFLIGTNEDEIKGESTKITATADWREYNASVRAKYLGFKNIVPYGGIAFTKLDGDFELEYSATGIKDAVDYNESDPFGILVGGSYYYGQHLRFQTEARFLDEVSLAFRVRYRF